MSGDEIPGPGIRATLVPADDGAFRQAFATAVDVAFVAEPNDDDARQAVLDRLATAGYPSVAIEPKRPMTMREFMDPKESIIVFRDGSPHATD